MARLECEEEEGDVQIPCELNYALSIQVVPDFQVARCPDRSTYTHEPSPNQDRSDRR